MKKNKLLIQIPLNKQITVQGVPKPMSQNSPGYFPPLIKQKKFLSTWVQK